MKHLTPKTPDPKNTKKNPLLGTLAINRKINPKGL